MSYGHILSPIDPGLAFNKAFRLKGDCVGLKQAVHSRFDPTSLSISQKLLSDVRGEDLARLGMIPDGV